MVAFNCSSSSYIYLLFAYIKAEYKLISVQIDSNCIQETTMSFTSSCHFFFFFCFKSCWFLAVDLFYFFALTFLGREKFNLFNFVGKLHWWMHSDRKLSWNEKDSCVRVGITILRAFYGAVARETTALSVRVWNGCLFRTRFPHSHSVMLMKWKEQTYFRGLSSN